MINLYILLIIHLIGDFYFLSAKMAKCKIPQKDNSCEQCKKCGKNYNHILIVAQHSLISSVLYLVICLFFESFYKGFIVFGIMFFSHFIIDLFINWVRKSKNKLIVFIFEQFLHVIIIFLIYKVTFFEFNISYLNVNPFFVKATLVTLLIIKPSYIGIKLLMESLDLDIPDKTSDSQGTANNKIDTGVAIGILERILVVLLIHFTSILGIAIIITAKTWARSKDLEDKNFRKQYITGTFASICIAILASLIIIS